MRTVLLLLGCATTVGCSLAAQPLHQTEQSLIGRWESFSFTSTNFDVFAQATNVILRFSCVEQGTTNAQTKVVEAVVEAEILVRGRNGREKPAPDSSGLAIMTADRIFFGGPGGFALNYSLTNGILNSEKHVRLSSEVGLDFKAHLRKVSSNPGRPSRS